MHRTDTDHQNPSKDQFFAKNVFGVSSVEFFWGVGLPVVVESTFLQLFLKQMGASSLAIGMIPTFFFIGNSLFALLSSYIASFFLRKKGLVIWLHLISSGSLLLFGGTFYLVTATKALVPLFFLCYGVFCICVGMTQPVWLSYLVNIFSARKSVAGLGYMNLFQNVGKLLSSIILLKFVETYAFSKQTAGGIFLCVGMFFGIGSLFFLFTREIINDKFEKVFAIQSFWRYACENIAHMAKNRNFMLFVMADVEFFVVVTTISFYANYATFYCGIDPAVAAGLFVGCIYVGAIVANVIWGSMGWLTLKEKAAVSKMMSIAALLLLIFFSSQWTFLAVSLLLGMCRGIRTVVMPPAVKLLSGLADATSYFALGAILTLPVAVGLPLITGHFLDRHSAAGADAYRICFGAGIVLILSTLFLLLKADFGPSTSPKKLN